MTNTTHVRIEFTPNRRLPQNKKRHEPQTKELNSHAKKTDNMKNLFLTAVLVAATALCAKAQNLKIGIYTVSFNAEAKKSIGFGVDISDNGGYLATCKDALAAISYMQDELQKKLTPNQKAAIYVVAKEQVPERLKVEAKIRTL